MSWSEKRANRGPALQELPIKARLHISRIANAFMRLAEERREILRLSDQMKRDVAEGRLIRTIPDHYGGEVEPAKWHSYKSSFGRDNEPTFRNRFVLDQIRDLDFRSFINFGCLYGWLEMEIHRRGKVAYGVDRSAETKKLNDLEFPGPNFVADDIFQFLQTHDVRESLFAHINTGTYFLPSFLISLYQRVYENGGRYIVIFEPSGVSRQTGAYFPYSEAPQPSVVFRGVMLLHNYPNLLKQAGFRIVRQQIVRPPHPHRDFRSAFFIASRA